MNLRDWLDLVFLPLMLLTPLVTAVSLDATSTSASPVSAPTRID